VELRSLKIKAANIPEEGLEFRFSQEGEKILHALSEKDRSDFSLHGLVVTGIARNIRNTVSLQVRLETTIHMECGRCLEPVALPFRQDFTYTLVPAEGKVGEEDPSQSDEDLNFGYYREDTIDLEPLILEQIVVQIPIKPLCSALCKGLCPHCGTNLNTGACGCEKEVHDLRFAALKNFKVEKKS
jgi:uncharacterized protein